MAKVPDKYLVVDPWKLIEDGYHPDRSKVSESLFALANEHQGLRAHFDEGYTGDSLIGSYLNGIYEEHYLLEPMGYKGVSNRICFMVNTVNWVYTRLELDGEKLDLSQSAFSEFRRELDFRSGELRRSFVWQTTTGKKVKLTFSRFLSMSTKELGFQRITLTSLNFSGAITITLGIDFSLVHETYGEAFWTCPLKEGRPLDEGQPGTSSILGVSKNIQHKVFAGFRVSTSTPVEPQYLEEEQFVGQRFSLPLTEGQESSVEKLSILYTTRNPKQSTQEVWAGGKSLIDQMVGISYQQCLQENERYWRAFWDRSDIVIEDDPPTQQGIRFCIFQLQQTYRGIVESANIGAKGLTGEVYNGNAFWDTELYCLPYYLFSNPDAARALIDFRYKTLPQALERAHHLDCEGACFPVATIDGTESCTLWQHASLQFQATTAVAYAIFHYAHVTQNNEFLYDEGAELLVHICRFLASRGQWSSRTNKFGYYGVMGPDEFQMMVNNNCYTNFMAQQTFRFTARTLAEMGGTQPEQKAALLARLSCTAAEVENWQHLADNMLIPYDKETGIYEQHVGFFDLPHLDVDTIPVEDFPLYHNWSYDRIYRNDMIKQPDVLMFMLLYNRAFTLAEKRANYDYYEPRCIHESSLSPSVHSILAAELGRPQEAADFFEFATRIDLDNYNRNTAEGIHTSSVAAAWMNIVYGFGGMRSDGDTLLFAPTIPEHWTSYCFQLVYRGSLLRVTVTSKQIQLQILEGQPVKVTVCDQVYDIDQTGLSIPMKGEA